MTMGHQQFKDVFPWIPYWSLEFSGGCKFPLVVTGTWSSCLEVTLCFDEVPCSTYRSADVVLWLMGFLVFGNPTFTLHTKKGAININEYLRLRSCIHTALCSHACTYYACKIFLGQWIKMTLRTYFVHLYTLLSIQTQPGFKIYCIGLFRVLLQLWFPSILGVLGRRPHP